MRTKKKEEGRERKMKASRRWERYREEAEREGTDYVLLMKTI